MIDELLEQQQPARTADFHFRGNWYGCDRSQPALGNAGHLLALCTRAMNDAGLQARCAPASHSQRQILPSGAQATVHLAESYVRVRTWPEQRFLSLEVRVCADADGSGIRGWAVLRALTAAFRPNEARDVDVEPFA